MRTEQKTIWDKVKQNVLNDCMKNHRDIDLQFGDLIVLGYDDLKNTDSNNGDDRVYVTMGIYLNEDGINSMGNVNLKDTIDLYHIDCHFKEKKYIDKCNGESYMETAKWWRTPTDDEVALYNTFFSTRTICKELDYIINELGEGTLSDDDIAELLISIKEKLQNN